MPRSGETSTCPDAIRRAAISKLSRTAIDPVSVISSLKIRKGDKLIRAFTSATPKTRTVPPRSTASKAASIAFGTPVASTATSKFLSSWSTEGAQGPVRG